MNKVAQMSMAYIESDRSHPESSPLVGSPASNLVKLLWQETIGRDPLKPRSEMALAVDAILTASLQLGLAAAKLGERLNAVDSCIDTLDDADSRRDLRQVTKFRRQQLTHSILELNARIKALSRLRDPRDFLS